MRKILIADDAEFFRVRISKILSEGCFEVLQASCGQQAVSLYQSEHPDLVLLDLTLSNMESLTSLKIIHDFDPLAKVIMLSVLGEETAVFEAIKLGARDYVRKPVDPDHFIFTIEKQLA